MQKIKVKSPLKLQGSVSLPLSKSMVNRKVMLTALSGGEISMPKEHLSTDVKAMLNGIKATTKVINLGAAGTAMRFLTAYWALQKGQTHVLTGSKRMKQRPIAPLVEVLRVLGANITYMEKEGFPPLLIAGKELVGGNIEIEASTSSQFVSALLMISPMLKNALTLHLKGSLVSKPYIDLTLKMMQQHGIDCCWKNKNTIYVPAQTYVLRNSEVETDWSSAAFWYAIVALHKDPKACLMLKGLSQHSLQGDILVVSIFQKMGIKTLFCSQGAVLTKTTDKVKHLEMSFIDAPDLVQPCVVACLALGISFSFKGLNTLPLKETNRIEALKTECFKMGYVLEDGTRNELQWNKKRVMPTEKPIETYEDHRMAMAFSAFSGMQKSIFINNIEVVSKSYPLFWNALEQLGYTLTYSEI